MAEGVAAGDDAHQPRVLVAGEVVPAPQRLQHAAYPLGLAPGVVEVEIDTKALALRARHSRPAENHAERKVNHGVCRPYNAAKVKQVPRDCHNTVVGNSTNCGKHL